MRERISNKMMEKENFNVVDIFGENVDDVRTLLFP